MARACMRVISGYVMPRRQPRWPSMGLNSCSSSIARSSFSLTAIARAFFFSPLARSVASSTISSSRFGRNSCSGGSSVRMVTGEPCISLKRPAKSARCIGSSFLRAPV